jgi:hypothetical protein
MMLGVCGSTATMSRGDGTGEMSVLTVRYHGQAYQLRPNTRSICIARTKVTVQEWFAGTLHVRHDRAGTIPITALPGRAQPPTAHTFNP